jgi:hypothetical protein
MNNEIFKYLRAYSATPENIDSLIVSAFLKVNNIKVQHNKFIKNFIIQEGEELTVLDEFISIIEKYLTIFNIEQLIELFEFVISPSDRVVNGAIYTPKHIRDYITTKATKIKASQLGSVKIADISCGCGGFLLTAAKIIKTKTKKTYFDIFKSNIFGLDIQDYSTTRTQILLSLLALSEGEDEIKFQFNLFVGDTLLFDWSSKLSNFIGFDIILGNPPYVSAKNLSEPAKVNLKNWDVCKSGNPDLYIPFFQIGYESLADNGILAYITMNSFFKSLNGRALREYFKIHQAKIKIIDFGAEQVFKSKNTYTCICFIENKKQSFIKYYKGSSKCLPQKEKSFSKILYENLNSMSGWNLDSHEIISKIEATGVPFGELYNTRHGLATLKNKVYIFKPVKEDDKYYYLQSDNLYPIEKGICRNIVNSNKLSRTVSLEEIKEKVIFPYDNEDKPKVLEESFIKNKFPKAFKYFLDKKHTLSLRDKGKGSYERWYAFGRTQSLEKIQNKVFFPKFSDITPHFIIESDKNLLFYNGQAIVGHSNEEMLLIKKIMQSRIFWYYIKTTSKPYSANYYSLNGNYVKNFGICMLNNNEIDFVLNEGNQTILDKFFEEKYDIQLDNNGVVRS